jgi:NAD(P)-dependent dehydrogenase (short-subunit alcohol dehydrogenase family)
MEQLEGKVAVVTGSASGLGRAMAERFAREGMTVVIADNRVAEAEIAASEINHSAEKIDAGRAIAVEVDVTQRDSVDALADRVDAELGGASVLVNNAGVVSYTPVAQPEEQGWRWIVDVNVFGVVYGLQAFLPRMLDRGDEGHIVNTASLAGVVGGGGLTANRIRLGDTTPESMGAMYGYMATKHAVVAVSETLALDLSGSPIGVSVLCPSHHENTGIFENSARYRPESAGGPMTPEEMQATFGRTDEQREEALGPGRPQKFPDECAARVVRAIREGQFFIFTHPDTRAAVEHRCAQIIAGFDDSAAFSG